MALFIGMSFLAKISEIDFSHRRKNMLTGEHILVSPHRLSRPWQGQDEKKALVESEGYDENCYLCPTNTRANGEINPDFKDTFIFENDFSALSKEQKELLICDDDIFQSTSANGIAKVLCFSPKHNLTMASMDKDDIEKVIQLWSEEVAE